MGLGLQKLMGLVIQEVTMKVSIDIAEPKQKSIRHRNSCDLLKNLFVLPVIISITEESLIEIS